MNSRITLRWAATTVAAALLLATGCKDSASEAPPATPMGTEAASTPDAAPLAASAASPEDSGGSESAPRAGAIDFAPGGPITDADLGDYYLSMTCEIDGEDVGTMTFDLWTEAAPITTRNFLRLADEGFYDGLSFHRILRGFMIQGGDPQGNGGGESPHGRIQAEFSTAPERQHGYGVLSMARFGGDENSASSQFFLCCDESESVWNLDGKYASFGRLTSGVATLEAVANVPVRRSRTGEPSAPKKSAKITRAWVTKGDAPAAADGEIIARPMPEVDFGDEPARVTVQTLRLGFAGLRGIGPDVTRTQEEARTLGQKLFEEAKGGADLSALIREHGDQPIVPDTTLPGRSLVLNHGLRDGAAERARFDLAQEFRAESSKLTAKFQSKELSREEMDAAGLALQEAFQVRFFAMEEALPTLRASLEARDAPLAKRAFSMEVGEVAFLEHDVQAGGQGYRIVKRLE